MKSENLITWSLPNFVTFLTMIVIIWVVVGSVGHIFVRQPAARQMGKTNTTVAPNGVAVA